MQITYPTKETDVAELSIDGNLIRYSIPPKIGTHKEVFQSLSADKRLTTAQGKGIVAYANGALVYRKNEWADQEKIRFPTKNYLRFPAVLTIIPKREEFGELEGGMLVDLDLEGEGIEKKTEVPKELSGWKASEGGILVKEQRIFVPYEKWYQEQWDENNGAVIALCSREGAESLARTAKDSKRNDKPLWKVDVNNLGAPEKRIPVLSGYDDGGLGLGCSIRGNSWIGCGAGVLK